MQDKNMLLFLFAPSIIVSLCSNILEKSIRQNIMQSLDDGALRNIETNRKTAIKNYL